MRPAVVTAVLLLVDILNTGTAEDRFRSIQPFCEGFKTRPCGDGWNRLDENRCVKFIWLLSKTFSDAEKHCRSLNSELVSLHSDDQMYELLCLNWRAFSQRQPFWIGAQKTGGEFKNSDGSKFDYTRWHHGQPDNAGGKQECIESNFNDWGWWNDVSCSELKFFMCAKKVPEEKKDNPPPTVKSCR